MHLLVGLGNPGQGYKMNRHNIGFMAIDQIADDFAAPTYRDKFHGQYAELNMAGQKLGLLKPQTMMNNSGQSVAVASKFYKIDPSQIIVFYDDLDLEPSKVRVRFGGGAGGHNGIRSIQAHLGTPDFIRVRMGIGHPGHKDRVTGYVLGNFTQAEQDWLEPLLESISNYLPDLIEGQESCFMTRVAENMKPHMTEEGEDGV